MLSTAHATLLHYSAAELTLTVLQQAWLHIKGLDQSVGLVPTTMTAVSDDEKGSIKNLTVSIHGNMAVVHIKQAKVGAFSLSLSLSLSLSASMLAD
jgi:hypothetical protein